MAEPFPDWPGTTWPSSLWRERSAKWQLPPVTTGETDILVMGAGFTGLWTAWHLSTLDPGLSVTLVDAMQPGYGASGRNGGWCSALMPMSLGAIADRYGRTAAIELQKAMFATVDDIGDFVDSNDVECGWHPGGTLTIATNSTQMTRAHAGVTEMRLFGFDENDARILDPDATHARISCERALGSVYSPHCAAVDPARLVDGLVRALRARGVRIHGSSRVTTIGNRCVDIATPEGPARVSARWVVRATEGFTPALGGARRDIAPIHSYMVATEPLDAGTWNEIGWAGRETFADGRHVVIYAQRTDDNRIAFGGRGAPYSFSSRTGPRFDSDRRIHDRIVTTMHDLFPATRGARITHRWGGALGVARDWFTSVNVNPTLGRASAGGYAGDGVAFSHLAARALAHSLLNTGDPASRLAIVGHRSRQWEPEPLRWIGINALLKLGAITDALEARGSRLATVTNSVMDRFVN